jgi:hypothetical protein
MKRIVVAIPYGLGFRNLACSGVLGRLVSRGFELTVLLPDCAPDDRPFVHAELPPGVQVEPLMVGPDSVPYRGLKFLKQHYYGERTKLESFAIKKRFRRRDSPVTHLFASGVERLAAAALPESVLDRWLLNWRYPYERHYEDALKRWRPHAVVVTKPGYHPDELAILKASRHFGIPVIAVDTTWDNMISKRPPYVLPSAATVWNDDMASQAAVYYQMPADAIHVTGGVQFDTFFRHRPSERGATLTALGLDPARPLILFGLSNPDFTAGTPEFARGLIDRIASGQIAGRPSLVIRTHPWDRGKTDYAAGTDHSWLRVERAYRLPAPGTRFECLPSRHDVERQGQQYGAADVIVNVAGTTSLDGIAVDLPVVNIAFDAIPAAHPDLSVSRFTSYSHYLPIATSGAVRVAGSWDELCEHINVGLRDRTADATARARIKAQFLGPGDDRAWERVADAIAATAGA